MAQVRFASVNRVDETAIDVHFVLPYSLRSSRFRRVEKLGRLFVHHMRLIDVSEMNGQLERWIRESYSSYGLREWLKKRPTKPGHR